MSRVGRAVVAIVAVALVAGGVYFVVHEGVGPLPDPEGCTASAAGHTVAMSTAQAENASIIASIAQRRGLPARAISIAIATAYQESELENIDHGDRDSLGLFQQRPSQGWGTPEQVTDPYYAANAFYDALVQVEGYEEMEITEAAQEVQRSAFPDAYADHEQDGRAIASAMSGYSDAAFSCVVHPVDSAAEEIGGIGLTPRADTVRRDVARSFGELPLGGFAPGGVRDGHMEGSAHYDGRAVDVFFRPVNADNTRRGWVLAHYLVANADRLEIDHVIFDDRIWSGGPLSENGWRDYDPPGLTGDERRETRQVLEHRDHVHVDVA
ncbi:MAG: hypothetical protein H0U28_10690 [Nocardioidaceae bacterium]|nr:hypothetical protein [Nocardioidaceae bacterium]